MDKIIIKFDISQFPTFKPKGGNRAGCDECNGTGKWEQNKTFVCPSCLGND